jgi:hypothetical protein
MKTAAECKAIAQDALTRAASATDEALKAHLESMARGWAALGATAEIQELQERALLDRKPG